jgi:hypothetical protein
MNADSSATYKQLEDGSWAVWTDREDCRPGQSITVTTASGVTKLEKLKRQIGKSRDGKLFLWAIVQKDEVTPLLPLK